MEVFAGRSESTAGCKDPALILRGNSQQSAPPARDSAIRARALRSSLEFSSRLGILTFNAGQNECGVLLLAAARPSPCGSASPASNENGLEGSPGRCESAARCYFAIALAALRVSSSSWRNFVRSTPSTAAMPLVRRRRCWNSTGLSIFGRRYLYFSRRSRLAIRRSSLMPMASSHDQAVCSSGWHCISAMRFGISRSSRSRRRDSQRLFFASGSGLPSVFFRSVSTSTR